MKFKTNLISKNINININKKCEKHKKMNNTKNKKQ